MKIKRIVRAFLTLKNIVVYEEPKNTRANHLIYDINQK